MLEQPDMFCTSPGQAWHTENTNVYNIDEAILLLFKGAGQGRKAEIQATHTEDWGNNRPKHQCQGNQEAKLRHQRARHHNAEQELLSRTEIMNECFATCPGDEW